MLGYYFRHYDPIADHYFIFDNGSSDGSLALLEAHPRVTVIPFETRHESFVLTALGLYNHAWKQSRGAADWVVICNLDEHFYHPRLRPYLGDCRQAGATAVPAAGFQMVADAFPDTDLRLCDVVRDGWRSNEMDKLGIFDPNAIDEIHYGPGRHQACPEGRYVVPRPLQVGLLHYKFLGLAYVLERHRELRSGLRRVDLERGWGRQYTWDEAKTRAYMEEIRAHARPVL
jgi:hypothetical protein